jgi:hypothetical protein
VEFTTRHDSHCEELFLTALTSGRTLMEVARKLELNLETLSQCRRAVALRQENLGQLTSSATSTPRA